MLCSAQVMAELEPFYIEKAIESLLGAVSEHARGRYNNSANRCYYAAFQAAVHALERAGILYTGRDYTWSHEALQETFARELINRRKVYSGDLRSVLTLSESLREVADYDRHWVTETQASRAIRRTRNFIDAIQAQGDGRP